MKSFKKILALSAMGLLVFSCTDILDNAQPSTDVSEDLVLGDPGGITAFRAGMYDRLHEQEYQTEYMLGPSALADELASRPTTTRYSGFAENTLDAGLAGDDTYQVSYELINDASIIINKIQEGVIEDDLLAQYRGEAYFLRALAMHHLARGLGYEPGMEPATGQGQGFDLSIEIRTVGVTTASEADFRPRKTNVQVYTQIKSDLMNAIDLLDGNEDGSPFYASKAAAEALLARVYLYERDFGNAEAYAADAIASSGANLATAAQVATMFDETVGNNPEGIFIISVDPATESLGVNNSLSSYTSSQWMAMVPTQDLLDLYESGDARLAWYAPCVNDVTSQSIANCLATHPDIDGGASGLEIQKWNAEQGSFADDVPMFRIAEMLLIQAEARVRGTGLGDPLTPLNQLRANRGLADYAGPDVLEAILDERRREFAAEGHRFFDLKRLGRAIRKPPELLSGIIQDVPYNDVRILDSYPDGEVALSEALAPTDSVLIQNPGY
jgi:hypothetical protein